MSPPSTPIHPAEDTRKMLIAGGGLGGIFFALALTLAMAFSERRIRFAETFVPFEHRVPVRQVSAADDADPHASDLLRNELQLQNLRKPRLVGKAPVIAITRADMGNTTEFAHALAQSFARSRMKTLFIEADILGHESEETDAGWSDLLSGAVVNPREVEDASHLFEIGVGKDHTLQDRAVSAPMMRTAMEQISKGFDIVVVSAGSLQDRLSTQFVLSNSEVTVLAVKPSDARVKIISQIDRLDSLPRNGSVAVLRSALAGDPWLAVRT
jgi:Mrp family chromosome partitioning ATPase